MKATDAASTARLCPGDQAVTLTHTCQQDSHTLVLKASAGAKLKRLIVQRQDQLISWAVRSRTLSPARSSSESVLLPGASSLRPIDTSRLVGALRGFFRCDIFGWSVLAKRLHNEPSVKSDSERVEFSWRGNVTEEKSLY